MTIRSGQIQIRNTRSEDIRPIIRLCKATYPDSWPWYGDQLISDLEVFPEGQLVAIDTERNGAVVSMAASLIIRVEDYPIDAGWGEMTDHGHFTNHDPTNGRTLYGAEIMVHPDYQGKGIGTMLYQAREELVHKLGLQSIRAGARLAGFSKYAGEMNAEEYVRRVVAGELWDPTVSFQLRRGFRVLAVVPDYFSDAQSLSYAAVIEWIPTP